METIEKYIAHKQVRFEQHLFFERLAQSNSVEGLSFLAKRISFWVMAFQDVLRINESLFTNSKLRNIALQHRCEDGGHNVWFLEDLKKLDTEDPKLTSLFSDDHTFIRDASYALVSEVFWANNDYERIALLLSIEATSHALFKNTAVFVERLGYSKVLKYFSYNHFNAEDNHESLKNNSLETALVNFQPTEDEQKRIFEIIDRTYEAFMRMYDCLAAALLERKTLVLS